jgi:cytochrome c-type biogenesis protein CcmE
MSKKSERRVAAQKKAEKRRKAILAVFGVCLVGVIVTMVIIYANRPDSRVFAVPEQSVTLYEDGNFIARLAHNINLSGTFEENVRGNVTEISFNLDGSTVSTQIEDDVLVLPIAWRAACRIHSHETEFPLRR